VADPIATSAARAIAQAFDDRYEMLGPFDDNWQEQCLGSALQALADQVAPSDADELRNYLPALLECQRIRREILAIAAKLDLITKNTHD
jgi:hypothetical protein